MLLALFAAAATPEGGPNEHVLLHTVPVAPATPAKSAEPAVAGADEPLWAHTLARRLGPHVNAATLLADWRDDKSRFQLNTTSRVWRGGNSLSLAALPAVHAQSQKNFTIAVLQMQAMHGRRNESMEKASALLRNAPAGHYDLLVLPELAFAGYVWDSAEEVKPHAEPANGPSYMWAKQAAAERGAHVLVGFVEKGDGDTLYNSAMMVSPTGELVTLARKTALTDTDAQWATPGSGSKSMPVVDTPFGRVGVGICKDMSAVPSGAAAGEHSMDENFRAAGVDIIVVLAAWDSQDPRDVVHNKWMARVGKHLGTKTLLVIAA